MPSLNMRRSLVSVVALSAIVMLSSCSSASRHAPVRNAEPFPELGALLVALRAVPLDSICRSIDCMGLSVDYRVRHATLGESGTAFRFDTLHPDTWMRLAAGDSTGGRPWSLFVGDQAPRPVANVLFVGLAIAGDSRDTSRARRVLAAVRLASGGQQSYEVALVAIGDTWSVRSMEVVRY